MKDILLMLPIAAGAAALLCVLLGHSEEKNALFLGFSPFRLALAGAAVLLTAFSCLVFTRRRKQLRFLWFVSGAMAVTSIEILLISRFPSDNSQNLLPLAGQRGLPLLLAMLLSACAWRFALAVSGSKIPRNYTFFLFVFAAALYLVLSNYTDRFAWQIDLKGNTAICASMIAAGCLWCILLGTDAERGWKTAAGVLFFAVVGYGVTRLTGMWMGRNETPPSAYWNELAESFLKGRLDLPAPSGTHDLTLYNGKWFVPNPPLPAILLMPFIAFSGSAAAVNTCVYSAALAGCCAGLFFLMLVLALTLPGTPLSRPVPDSSSYPDGCLSAVCWITVLFTFGTDLLWLGTTGQMWFISQLTVVLFTLLAVIFTLCGASPVVSGICLGLGVLSRPNIFPVFLCLLGIMLYREREFPRIHWKKTFLWCLKCGIPVVFSAGCLLLYNKLRFDDWMDFGYVTINGADWILDSVQKYGMFHPHFLKTNAGVMLFGLPRLDFSGERFFFQPHVEGYSMFLMTPALIYIFRAFRKNWFSVGCWASVILSMALLLLYHNTGAEQVGYRYMLDFAAPLALLTADGVRKKPGLLFRILTVFSVVLSFTAVYWWYLGRV